MRHADNGPEEHSHAPHRGPHGLGQYFPPHVKPGGGGSVTSARWRLAPTAAASGSGGAEAAACSGAAAASGGAEAHSARRPLSPFQKALASTGFLPGSVSRNTSSNDPSPQTRRSAPPPAASATCRPAGGGSPAASGKPSRVWSSLTRIGSAPQIERRVHVPGQPAKARTLLCASDADSCSSRSSASAVDSFAALVARASSCGASCPAQLPSHTDGRASSSSSVPRSNNSRSRGGSCSSPTSGLSSCLSRGPASILRTVKATLTPATESPASRHRCSGAAPRYSGSSDGWTLSVPKRGMSRKRCGRKQPYAAVMQRSGCSSSSRARKASSFALAGVSSSMPRASASVCTGDAVSFIFRPDRAGGCDTTAATSKPPPPP
mmetsp:Transcript_1941/g.6100  ORF Transcript_1941/g.6100 Transcript_1941/m.6100 type:complete len:378 (-) Transcript_1941:143-1276(-)